MHDKWTDVNKLKLVDYEYIGLMLATGYTFLKSELLYENTGLQKYILITFITFMLFLYSLAKLEIFNIFKIVRNIPKYCIKIAKFFWNDYKIWKSKNNSKSCEHQ